MNFFSQVIHADYGRFFQSIKEVSKKEHRSSVILTLDVAVSTLVFGSALTDYFNYEFYKRSYKERKKYAVVKTQDKFYTLVNDPKYKKNFSVKPNFLREFAKYNGREWIYPDGNNYEAYSSFLDRHDTFMVKPIDGLGGGGIFKASLADVSDRKKYYQFLIDNRYYLEQVIVQSKEMAALNPSSVNTIRVMTCNIEDDPQIFFCSVRVGNNGAVVDNFHSGGMSAVVDNDTGVVTGPAMDKAMNRFERHPSTGVVFKGFQIPRWEEVKAMVYDACRMHPEMTVIGWDVAITEEGPLLIEGNRRPGFDMVQMLVDEGQKYVIEDMTKRFLKARAKSE